MCRAGTFRSQKLPVWTIAPCGKRNRRLKKVTHTPSGIVSNDDRFDNHNDMFFLERQHHRLRDSSIHPLRKTKQASPSQRKLHNPAAFHLRSWWSRREQKMRLTGADSGSDAPLPSLQSRIYAVILILVFTMQLYSPHTIHSYRTRKERRIDRNARVLWHSYVAEHPVVATERYAFKELGLRSSMYMDSLLRKDEAELSRFDRSLWKSIPGAGRIRKAAQKKVIFEGVRRKTAPRGFVTVANSKNALDVFYMIDTIRQSFQVELPIQVFFWSVEDIPLDLQSMLVSFPHVTVHDLARSDDFDDSFTEDDGAMTRDPNAAILRAMALLATDLVEVIYFEPDSKFLANPLSLFDNAAYLQRGSLFFHAKRTSTHTDATSRFISFLKHQFDRGSPSAGLLSSSFWNFQQEHRVSTGVMVLDKSRPSVLSTLFLNVVINDQEMRSYIWSRFPESQRESLWVAFEMAGLQYHIEPLSPGAIGSLQGKIEDTLQVTICPALPLHLLTEVSSSQGRHSLPFWIEGRLHAEKGEEHYMTANAWSMHGLWSTRPEGWCLGEASFRPLSDHDLDDIWDSTITSMHQITRTYRMLLAPFADVPWSSLNM